MSSDPASAYPYKNAGEVHMHEILFPAVAASIQRHAPNTVLDLGCGNGYLTNKLKHSFPGISFAGLDPSETGIAEAKSAFPDAVFRQGSVYDEPPADWVGSFDMVISTEVVEHLYAPKAMPSFIRTVLKPSGIAVITTPYHGYLKNLALSVLDKWDSHHTVFWDHGHIKFWSRKTLTKLFEDESYTALHFKGIGRCPWLWMTMLMEFSKQ
ncbi:MAG: class I SAM-dependent methyltransferase [Verrucomicrobiales bacterium]|nr:class I SAM-dependent methyltransferase [Verrucomicrobiales bacterium]